MQRETQQLHTASIIAIMAAFLALFVMLAAGNVGAAARGETSPTRVIVSAPAHESETEHPRETETEHPEATETEHPRETETEHPEATETEHPRETETEHPEATETEHPRETETEHPRATGTAQPAALVPGSGTRTYRETGKAVNGLFLQYWDRNGGLMQQGFPISKPMRETSRLNGKTYAVQYFERAVFEYHPENKAPFDVLLSQLGTFRYNQKYPGGAPNQAANRTNAQFFPQTGHWVGGTFLAYWKAHGGLAQQGYPLSEEFQEKSDLDGKTYTVQYFERAIFERHPENKAPFDVLLSQLGTFSYKQNYGK